MLKRYGAWIAFLLLLAIIVGQSVAIATDKENVKIHRAAVFDTIRKGYEAQYAIRGRKLSSETMYQKLSPYFTDNFLQVFTDENSDDTKGTGTYLLTKTAPFSFTSKTKTIYDQEHGLLYVYEHLKDKAIYEVVSLQQMDGTWKLAGYHSNKILLAEIKELEKEQKENG